MPHVESLAWGILLLLAGATAGALAGNRAAALRIVHLETEWTATAAELRRWYDRIRKARPLELPTEPSRRGPLTDHEILELARKQGITTMGGTHAQ